jgi:regulator of protease activity HflC (stomatin/prohibitin superfamily)
MFGVKFIKVQPTDFILQYRGGKLVREGAGLSFFYFAPTTSLVLIPEASVDAPFIFEEVTADFQEVTVQGQITYRVSDPKKLSKLMNFTLAASGKSYTSDDPQKLPQRLVNHAQVLTRSSLRSLPLRAALAQTDGLEDSLREGMRQAEVITSLGIEVLGLSILAVKPTPETARALEAEAREQILREADEAVYARRNAAVEQERGIKENELNTEIAVENKKRQIRETQMEAEKSVQGKRRELREAEMATEVALEESRKQLVALSSANAREQADAQAYAVAATMKALSGTDPKVLQALTSVGMDPGRLVALAFKELAEGTDKIGQLNISPDLLRELLAEGRKADGPSHREQADPGRS